MRAFSRARARILNAELSDHRRLARRPRRRCSATRRPTPARSSTSAITTRSTRPSSSPGCAREKSVLIVPGDHFGMDGYLRIGFGDEPDYLRSGARPRCGVEWASTANRSRRFRDLRDLRSDARRLRQRRDAVRVAARRTKRSLARDYGFTLRDRRHRHAPARSRSAAAGLDAAPAPAASESGQHSVERSDATLTFLATRCNAAPRQRGSGASSSSRRRRSISIAESRRSATSARRSPRGAHVVTANKGPVAFAYRRLARAADARRSSLPVRRRGDGRRADLQSRARDAAGGPRRPAFAAS